MLRLVIMRPRPRHLVSSALLAVVTASCGSQVSDGLSTEPSGTPSASGAPPGTVAVVLLHCGMQPVTVESRIAAPASSGDGDPDLPLDATNTPDDWVGRGTVVVSGDRMTYTDEGGEVVEFVPDDGVPSPPCA